MFTKPLLADQFHRCKQRLPGIVWDNNEEEHEIQMLEFVDNKDIEKSKPFTVIFQQLLYILKTAGALAQLVLYAVGLYATLRYFCCPVRGVKTRTVGVPAPCTYTALRGVANPRFLVFGSQELEVEIESSRLRSASSRRSVE